MTQALFTAMTGLNAGTNQLTVVSDNVANMNTTAYKTSRVDFQDIWYQTTTTGTNSTAASGGTNPYQVGVGVKCSAITKDFSAGSINTTGRTEDMAIQGEGWFTVVNSDGAVLLTRDGSFSRDENGYLVTANGCKLLGMDDLTSETRSDVPIKLPTSIKVIETATELDNFKTYKLGDLNNAQINDGYFHVEHKAGTTTTSIMVPVDTDQTVDAWVTNLTNGTAQIKVWNETGGTDGKGAWENGNASDYFTIEIADGTFKFTAKQDAAGNKGDLNFSAATPKNFTEASISNFASATELSSVTADTTLTTGNSYTSKITSVSAQITEVDDIKSDLTKDYKSFSVGMDGLVTATYSDGSVLTVKANEDGTTYFSYTNSEGIIINNDKDNSGKLPLYVDPNVLVKANMQIQFAKVVNDGGLVAQGSNLYSIGVNCGDVIYSASNVNGIGGLATGALESSNVDLAQQFSNMILAQRLVQANSQVFSGANSMLETLVYLGQ